MKTDLKSREYEKFRNKPEGKTSVATIIENETPINVSNAGVDWDKIETTFPAVNQEIYTYKKDNDIVQIVTITYEDSKKHTIIDISKVRP